jgi:hypothetical protein
VVVVVSWVRCIILCFVIQGPEIKTSLLKTFQKLEKKHNGRV